MQVTCTRKSFLQNTHNKTELIRILRQRFTEIGNENEQSVCDADVLAIKKALEMAKHHQTTVVCDDTDILLLLVSLVLHNEGYRVRYERKCQQQEGTRGIFSEGCRQQAAPNTISVVCPGLDRL